MSGPYFQKRPWRSFVHDGQTYDLAHMIEYQLTVVDSGKQERRIAVTFDDHCFTRKPEVGDDPLLAYPGTNPVRHFCVARYWHSLSISGHIADAVQRPVWNLGHDSYAVLPVIDSDGVKMYYGIIFSLDRVKGFPVDLHMRVKTAHPRDEREIVTYGSVRFPHLVFLRIQRKSPKRLMGRSHRLRLD